jgi:hypothetical protein
MVNLTAYNAVGTAGYTFAVSVAAYSCYTIEMLVIEKQHIKAMK